jgi:hypothetical protein
VLLENRWDKGGSGGGHVTVVFVRYGSYSRVRWVMVGPWVVGKRLMP